MKNLNKNLLLVLGAVIAFALFQQFSNPSKKYSTQSFWKTATVSDVANIPQQALLPGNKNGPVLMWAAMASTDPNVIAALIGRGAGVNEPDSTPFLSGTPLSAAAGVNSNPEVIDMLLAHGAEIDKVVGSKRKTPLIIAAEINPNAKIIENLIAHGASTTYKDSVGRNALEAAIYFRNESAVAVLKNSSK